MAKIVRIISGGQTGADRGGLDAAIYAGIPHGGWCPKGRIAEDGAIPAIYDLKETKSANYKIRTEWNVRDADVTIIFTDGELEGGSLATARFCEKHGKPWLHVDLKGICEDEAVMSVTAWLAGMPGDLVLNVAGQRESKAPGIQRIVAAAMAEALKATGRQDPKAHGQ